MLELFGIGKSKKNAHGKLYSEIEREKTVLMEFGFNELTDGSWYNSAIAYSFGKNFIEMASKEEFDAFMDELRVLTGLKEK